MKTELSLQQRTVAMQRITALWAFCESGLGGLLHAFHIPVTGLVLGSMSVLCICLVGFFSSGNYAAILKSLLVVLIVKAVVSPQTPFPAYIAVSFQALIGYILFSILQINFITIFILAVMAMLESALQKLLLLTLFFGKSFWTGIDEMVKFITKPFGFTTSSGSYWVVGIYLLVYVTGGIITAFTANRLLRTVRKLSLPLEAAAISYDPVEARKKKPLKFSRILLLVSGIGVIIFAGIYKGDSAGMLRSLVWTLAALILWYLAVAPVITTLVQKLLVRSPVGYKMQASQVISFIPFLRQLSGRSWNAAKKAPAIKRIPLFISILVTTVLTFQPKPITPEQ